MDIQEEVLRIIRTEFDRPEAVMESDLYVNLHFDSVDMMELIFALEEDYDIEIPDKDMVGWGTVEDIVRYVKEKRGFNEEGN